MAQIRYTDAISTLLAQPVVSVTATQIEVVDVSQMPVLSAGDWFYLSLYDNDTGDYEMVRVNQITGNILSVDRGIGAKAARLFGVNETSVVKWIIGLDWDDLRVELKDYAATPAELAASIVNFLDQTQIQALIDTSLIPYITITAVDAAIANFLTEVEIQALIDASLTGYTTTAEATTIAETVVDDEVTNRQLQNATQVDTSISNAIAAAGFLSAVSITDNGETVGKLAGDGTPGDPLTVDWGASNPDNVLQIPANTAHRSNTNNPHGVTALQARSLTIDNPTGDQVTFVPTDDFHPANKKYVDDTFAAVVSTPVIDLTDVGSDTGRVILGSDSVTPAIKLLRCWQEESITWTGEGDYVVAFPANNQLDQPPTDIVAILDVVNQSTSERKGADMSLYVAEVTTSQVTFVIDVAKEGFGYQNSQPAVIKLGYFGKKTIP